MRVVDLFCGAGGLSLGLRRVGFNVVQAYDCWDQAVAVYRKNVGPHAWQVDLRNIFKMGPMLASMAPDLVVGGPPCQDFSPAGDRVEGERAEMTKCFAMLVCIAKPSWIVMENVPQASSSKSWSEARRMLFRAGYGLTEAKLNAAYYGVPQTRKRLFVVGRLGEQDGFLNSALASARTSEPMTIRSMLRSDDPDDQSLEEAEAFFTRPFYTGRGVRSLDEPAPAVIRTTREPPRPGYLASPHPDDPVPAAKAALLTQRQVARIQGFPSNWDWADATSRDIDQMIANAIPAPIAEAIGRVVLARELGASIPEIHGRFGSWLLRSKGFSKAAVRNAKSRVNRARRLLLGRTFSNGAVELAVLEATEAFAKLSTATRSDLRKALCLYREWQNEPKGRRVGAAKADAKCEAAAA
ncbi:DNA (cytosine-5-)-methyltransferase [Rhodopseudomonas palustris]|uniref:DNA cytosine methyltransferase n=1 Tax=Rhodopseudomonas palustris TaxID=1076 RepID=UPI0022F10D2D|nr:DNA (cytosine-5-)-methyltransferase [Rhodopseudomonas palustris]WBU27753.1 DNA (cytosine-5-)-methyltransferase [Rhodopseudomonas palustris]